MHRALSWLNRAEREPDDYDARFIFLWIAFNAAYAQEFPNRRDFSETRLLLKFLNRLIDGSASTAARRPRAPVHVSAEKKRNLGLARL